MVDSLRRVVLRRVVLKEEEGTSGGEVPMSNDCLFFTDKTVTMKKDCCFNVLRVNGCVGGRL